MKANMTNEEKAKELIKEIYPSTSMGDYGLKEQLLLEAMKWKDEQFKESVNKAMKYLETNLQLTEAESTHIRKLFNF